MVNRYRHSTYSTVVFLWALYVPFFQLRNLIVIYLHLKTKLLIQFFEIEINKSIIKICNNSINEFCDSLSYGAHAW